MTLEQKQAWMAQWKRARLALARVREIEASEADLATIALQLEGPLLAALSKTEPRCTSGLVEQQRVFRLKRE